MEVLEQGDIYEKQIEEINKQYQEIKNPSNKQWIDWQIQLNLKYVELLEYNNSIESETNESLSNWNEFNEEHISQGLTAGAEKEHLVENEFNDENVQVNEGQIQENIEKIEEARRKIAFYEKIQQKTDIENIENIEDATETLYNFSKTDLAKEIEGGFEKWLEGIDIDLFTAYTKIYNQEENKTASLKEYLLLEHFWGEYVEYYCGGDATKANEELYVQFFTTAIETHMDKVGEEGFFKSIRAVSQGNKINKAFDEQYTNKEGKWFGKIGKSVKIFMKGFTRSKEYKSLMDTIEEMEMEAEQESGGNEVDRD